jgi:hypothetical protein
VSTCSSTLWEHLGEHLVGVPCGGHLEDICSVEVAGFVAVAGQVERGGSECSAFFFFLFFFFNDISSHNCVVLRCMVYIVCHE